MKSEFILTNTLSNTHIDLIYQIHEIVYCSKGIGLEKSIWKTNLQKRYHAMHEKMIQIFYNDDNLLIGYNILTEPYLINTSLWSKIIEGGVTTNNNSKNSKHFLQMYRHLLNWNKQVNYLGETSILSNGVTSLLIKSGFNIASRISEFESILKVLLNSTNFLCVNKDDSCIVKRETAIIKAYEAFVLLYKPKN